MSQPSAHATDSETMKEFIAFLDEKSGKGARLYSAMSMLKAKRFQLFSDVQKDDLIGVINSQSSVRRIYACYLTAQGDFNCSTQYLNRCAGLGGRLCKHLLVLIIGLAQNGAVDIETVKAWVSNSIGVKPTLDKERMSAVFLRYKGMEAGEVDWRPTETVPEDFYIY